MSAITRGRGRPPVADADTLRARAIDILVRDGYAGATMGQIAAELGVGLRTLHRYFPTKADIVWGGIEGALDALRRGFEAADEAGPVVDAIIAVVVEVFAQDADDGLAVGRARLEVISLTPELESTRPEIYRRWREETVAFIARRLGLPPDDVRPRAAGAAIQTVVMEALVWWATQGDDAPPAEVVARALEGLAAITRE